MYVCMLDLTNNNLLVHTYIHTYVIWKFCCFRGSILLLWTRANRSEIVNKIVDHSIWRSHCRNYLTYLCMYVPYLSIYVHICEMTTYLHNRGTIGNLLWFLTSPASASFHLIMPSSAYDGKGVDGTGWLDGLMAWWMDGAGLSSRYVYLYASAPTSCALCLALPRVDR